MAGETDTGLTFGAAVDLDEGGSGAAAVANNRDDGGIAIFLSGAFGTLTLGDTDGGLDWALTEVNFSGGSLNDDETEHAGYNGNSGLDGSYDGQILRYDYAFGEFGAAVSVELDDDNFEPGTVDLDGDGVPDTDPDGVDIIVDTDDEQDPIIGLGFRGGFDFAGTDLGFGIGFQTAEDADAIGASINASLAAGLSAGLSYLTLDADDDSDIDGYDHIGVGVGFTTGAIRLHANYGIYDFDSGAEESGFGLAAGYDLGGGAEVQLGYGYSEADDGVDTTEDEDFNTLSFGVSMSF
jgi:outer membrane protein OmpU